MIALASVAARAVEPERPAVPGPKDDFVPEAVAEVTEPVIPERELEFEVMDEAYPVKLPATAVDPKLMEQRYVAVFRLPTLQAPRDCVGEKLLPEKSTGSTWDRETRYRFLRETGIDSSFQEFERGEHFCNVESGQVWVRRYQRGETFLFASAFPFVFAAICTEMPPERQPSPELVAALTAEAEFHVSVETVIIKLDEDRLRGAMQFEIYAPTPERAEELVRAIFAMYDYGFSYPLQEAMIKARRDSLEKAADAAEAYQKAKEEVARLEKEIESFAQYADISTGMLSDLKTQQRMIEIEMVGVEARIKACQTQTVQRMKEASAGSPLLDQIVGLKVAAEIELAGLAAKRAAMQETIEGAEQLATARRELAQAKGTMLTCDRESSRLKNAAALYAELRERAEPLAIEDGKVAIHPIKWAPAADK